MQEGPFPNSRQKYLLNSLGVETVLRIRILTKGSGSETLVRNTFYFVGYQILSQAALAAHDCYEPSQPGPQTAYRGATAARPPHTRPYGSAAAPELAGGSHYSSQQHIYMEVDPLYCRHQPADTLYCGQLPADPLYCGQLQADPLYCGQLPHSSTQVELLLSSPGEEEEPCCSTPGLLASNSSNSSQSSSGYSTAPSDTYCYADQLNVMNAQQQQQQQQQHLHQFVNSSGGHHRLVLHPQGHNQQHQHHHHGGSGLVLRPAAYNTPQQHLHHHSQDGVAADASTAGGGLVFSISQGCELRTGTGGGSTRRGRGNVERNRKSLAAAVMGHNSNTVGGRNGGGLLPLEHQLIRLDENHVI